MKIMLLLGLVFLAGCKAHIEVRLNHPGQVEHVVVVDTMRRTMVAVDGGQVTVITGQVAIDDETVNALGRAVIPVLLPSELDK